MISKITNHKSQATNLKKWFITTMRTSCGFTLIELLVVISVTMVVGMVLAGILISTLRGSTKATVLSDVKQNGDYVLLQMTKVIRSAATLDLLPCGNPSPATQTITAIQNDNSKTIFDCSGSTITANGNSLLDTSTTKLVPSSCAIVCRQQSSADTPIIQIQFSLMQSTSGNFVEGTATVPFQTSIFLRNTK